MDWSRAPAVEGTFYPKGETLLRSTVEELLANAQWDEPPQEDSALSPGTIVPKAIIAPHAGYVYSGPIAASAYSLIIPAGDRIKRVVLLGPAHRYPVRGMAACSAASFHTPLGPVALDREGIREVLELDHVHFLDAAHEGEHSLEVHLPFLQVTLEDFTLIPLVVGEASPEEVAEVLRVLWGGPETLIVVSSDLSHFLTHAKASELDAETARAVVDLRFDDIGFDQACGRMPMSGLLLRVREEGL